MKKLMIGNEAVARGAYEAWPAGPTRPGCG